MGRALIIAAIVIACGRARADDGAKLLGETPYAEAERLFDEATTFADQKDFVAAAIVFGQVQEICAGIERGPDGAIVDADAHALRHDAINNEAATYSLARKPVEAAAAFQRLRDEFGAELTADDLAAVDRKIALMEKQIGTITVTGTPADVALEVRIDGRRRKLAPGAPFRIEEGTHSIEIKAAQYQDFITEAAVLGGTDVPLSVALEPLQTPANVRFESTVSGAGVTLDGKAIGDAPIEVAIAPGKHTVEVRAESYLEQTVPFEVGPGERTIVRVSLSKRRAPLGVRIAPYFVTNVPLRSDTPFGTRSFGAGLHLFHQALTYRNIRFGLAAEYNQRSLNELGIGGVATVCPDAFSWSRGRFGVCPFQLALHGVVDSSMNEFRSGWADGRLSAALEWRTDPTVVRLGGGLTLESYNRIPPAQLPAAHARGRPAAGPPRGHAVGVHSIEQALLRRPRRGVRRRVHRDRMGRVPVDRRRDPASLVEAERVDVVDPAVLARDVEQTPLDRVPVHVAGKRRCASLEVGVGAAEEERVRGDSQLDAVRAIREVDRRQPDDLVITDRETELAGPDRHRHRHAAHAEAARVVDREGVLRSELQHVLGVDGRGRPDRAEQEQRVAFHGARALEGQHLARFAEPSQIS